MHELKLPKTLLRLGVTLGIAVMLSLFGCDDDDDADTPLTDGLLIQLTAQSAAMLDGLFLNFDDVSDFFNLDDGENVILNSEGITAGTGRFVLDGVDGTARGDVTFGSCTYEVDDSRFPQDDGPQVGDTFIFPSCDVVVESDVEIGTAGNGTITLRLTNQNGNIEESNPENVPVEVTTDGAVIINNVNTGGTVQ